MIVDRLLRAARMGGTWVLYLLIALSILSFTAMLERWIFFRKRRDDVDALRRKIDDALTDDDEPRLHTLLRASPSIEAEVVRSAIRWAKGGADAVTDAVDSELGRVRKELERGTTLLGTLGTNAPFVGLFGTVLGVIEAFAQLGGGANKAAMGNVMSGIAEALVATGVGLFVALPAVVAYNLVQKKIGEIENETLSLAKLVTAWLKTRKAIGTWHEPATEASVSIANHSKAEADSPSSHALSLSAAVAAADGAE